MFPDFDAAQRCDKLEHPLFEGGNYDVFVKREDLVHPKLNGNKWRKLKYNIEAYKKSDCKSILSFGGAYSNHLAALSYASNLYDFPLFMIVRGEQPKTPSNTLKFAEECGVNLIYVSRAEYRRRTEQEWLQELQNKYNAYIIPEGGSNIEGVKGCMEILPENVYDYVMVATATGATLAGLSASCDEKTKCIGISVLNDQGFLMDAVLNFHNALSIKRTNYTIISDYTHGGYAKRSPTLDQFIRSFNLNHSIPIEFVYSGKLFFAFFDLLKNGYFKEGSRILLVHTGGLQYMEDQSN
ncbi:MAG TPA: pyridoxal-phosphate dependent enzyme [Bacteroidia bacterium]|nr:pyridoxal-phosphate dependent enzyme [Bacteroidia bacterium]